MDGERYGENEEDGEGEEQKFRVGGAVRFTRGSASGREGFCMRRRPGGGDCAAEIHCWQYFVQAVLQHTGGGVMNTIGVCVPVPRTRPDGVHRQRRGAAPRPRAPLHAGDAYAAYDATRAVPCPTFPPSLLPRTPLPAIPPARCAQRFCRPMLLPANYVRYYICRGQYVCAVSATLSALSASFAIRNSETREQRG